MNAPFGLPAELAELSDEYEFVAELGRGGSAVVYRAQDRALGRDVAIKVVHPRPTSPDDDPVARLAREARTVAQLAHPSIVTIYAVRRLRSGGLALVLRLVPGTTLKAEIQLGGPVAPERAERILRDVAEALAYAHARGVIHRDVKPENIFLDEESGRALLADFGIARSGDADSMTMTGTAIGTPFYMSPEQVEGGALDGRSDLYSLGLVAWEMLTGRRPWDGESLYNVIYKQKHEELAPIEALRPGVPHRLQYLIERMLQKRPGARWAGADGLLVQLNHTVLPSDYTRWQSALPGRVERYRTGEREREREREQTSRQQAQALVTSGSSTVRFTRGVRPLDRGSITRDGTPLTGDAALAHTTQLSPAGGVLAPARRAASYSAPPEHAASAASALTEFSVGEVSMSEAAAPYDDYAEPVWGSEAPTAVRPRRHRWLTAAGGALAVSAVVGTVALKGGLNETRTAFTRATLGQFVPRTVEPPGIPPSPPLPPAVLSDNAEVLAITNPPPRATGLGDVVSAGGRSSCAITYGAALFCWGANDRGQLGDATDATQLTPTRVTGLLPFTQVSVGLTHACAVTRLGDVYCWGSNTLGQLGDATLARRIAPVRIAGPGSYRVVRTGAAHSCAIAVDGTVHCWGSNAHGELGDGSRIASPLPRTVRLPADARAAHIAVGAQFACALLTDGRMFCWGANADGQLGDGTRAAHVSPVQAAAGETRYTLLAAGGAHVCAVTTDGALLCWGRDDNGQLGDGGRMPQLRPTPVALPAGLRITALSAGIAHSCALGVDGDAWCWGRNTHGEIGDGTITGRLRPTRVRTLERFAAISAGTSHSCAIGIAGAIFCWGFNPDGQLGDSTRFRRLVPTSVALPAGVTAATVAMHP